MYNDVGMKPLNVNGPGVLLISDMDRCILVILIRGVVSFGGVHGLRLLTMRLLFKVQVILSTLCLHHAHTVPTLTCFQPGLLGGLGGVGPHGGGRPGTQVHVHLVLGLHLGVELPGIVTIQKILQTLPILGGYQNHRHRVLFSLASALTKLSG